MSAAEPTVAPSQVPVKPIEFEVRTLNRAAQGAGYSVVVVNNLDAAQQVVLVQRFAQPPVRGTASDSGKVSEGGILWALDLAPRQVRTVTSEVSFGAGQFVSRSSACLREVASGRTFDCASGDVVTSGSKGSDGIARGVLTVVAWLALAIAVAFLILRLRHTRLAAAPAFIKRHREGTMIAGAVLAIVVVSATAFLYITGRARDAIDLQDSPQQALGWEGRQRDLPYGLPTMADRVEFTLYHWLCVAAKEGPVCEATVGLRNTSNAAQFWYPRLQRLQYTDGTWVSVDQQQTLVVNASADQFAPIQPGERRFAVLVFRPAAGKALAQLEMRDGTFNRGVAFRLGA